MPRMSVATIDRPEFINITPYNPLISECEIKVFYLGDNRNGSYITKDVAINMANSLPGCPIVGYYKQENEDFRDHGDRVIMDDSGIHFECMTRPYGFVAPDAKVWFQKFEEEDEYGRSIIREYMMTTGYLWTGQYEEAKKIYEDGGRPQSMELDEDTLDGQWARKYKNGMDFFIINDAIFSKLCILGEDVEPCFEGASVTAPDISTSFTKVDEGFTKTLFDMMNELKFALKGEQKMVSNIEQIVEETTTQEVIVENQEVVENSFAASDDKKDKEEDKKEESAEDKKEESKASEDEEDEDKKKYTKADDEKEEKVEDKKEESSDNKKEEDEEEKKKYALLQEEHSALLEKFSALETSYNELLAFKNQVEDKEKDELINSFYMLSEEDKADVVANKAQYSLDEIESKLSVICVRKKVNFDLEDSSKNDNTTEESPVVTFSLDEQASAAPAWITALRNTQKSRNI